MEIYEYNVGDIPSPIAIDVRDRLGRPVNCAALYTNYEVVMLDSRDQPVDLSGSSLDSSAAQLGRFIFTWPNKSLFTRRGDYVLQLRLSGNGKVEHTTAATLRVFQLGKVYR
jgi:hypothetical protein